MDILKIYEMFPNQKSCIDFLEKEKWGGKVVCAFCGSNKTKNVKSECRHKCYSCKKSFSVLKDTIFEKTKLPLQKWFIAIHLICGAKKGVSSLQLSRHIKVNKDTALYLQRRIRKAMKETAILDGIVEIDETYIGGSLTKMNQNIKEEKNYHPVGMNHKTPILGMYQRKGKIVLKVLNKAWSKEIRPIMDMTINPQSIIVSDGFGAYSHSKKKFKDHYVMNHSKKKFKDGLYNTSTLEGFWAMLKRAVIGTYHQISIKYLQEYMDELSFKFNYKDDPDIFNLLINKSLSVSIPTAG